MGPLTKKQWKKYKRSTKCHICYKPFTLKDPKVRDHCHYTGLYRCPAHSLCNLRYKIPSYIPVGFHNLSGYDAHLFIRELGGRTFLYISRAGLESLKHTGIKLELLTDPDMLLMFEQGIRGGITQAVRKYALANNKYMGDKFDPKSESSYLQYLDVNNLYGWAMSQPLPTGGFKWVDVNPNEISELATRTDKGYLLEVDLVILVSCTIHIMTSHLCVRGWKLMEWKSWYPTSGIKRIMLSTFKP